VSGVPLPRPGADYVPWILAGTLAQILATALMLAAMNERSFVVSIAYIKTEPVQVALFGLVFLGDKVTLPIAAAILVATVGVLLMSLRPGAIAAGGNRPALLGISAGAMFALSAVGYRGAILSLDTPSYVMAATFTLAVGLAIQAVLLSAYLAVRDRTVLSNILRAWRPSMAAGFLGALASQFWFLAFALATAASVRTLALVEVLFAQAISTFFFRQRVTPREILGIFLVVGGVALLLWAH
jgi:drug/metabolite transporter (DMT)-like permease